MRMRVVTGFGPAAAALAGVAVLAGPVGSAVAGPQDYRFEAVQKDVPATANAMMAVRLVHIPDNKPVAGAILFQPKLEMPMEGMAPMMAPVKAAAPDGKGNYPFTADFSAPGPWVLTVSAKVQGEPGTVTGSVPFVATAGSAAADAHSGMAGMAHGH